MSGPQTDDILRGILFGTLLGCAIGLAGYIRIRLGRKEKKIEYRGIALHLNPALPAGRIVFIDRASLPICDAVFERLDVGHLPPDCTGALLSPADYASLLARQSGAKEVRASQRIQA